MNLLALSTSTSRGSAALIQADGSPSPARTSKAYADLAGHAERIFDAIDRALAEASQTRASISAIACDVGPGSFTGVRVGVATAKGIAIALGVPVYGVSSLAAMAAAAFATGQAGPDEIVLALLDAKKNELFAAAFTAAGEEVLVAQTVPAHAAPGPAPANIAGHPIVVVGGFPSPWAFDRGLRSLPDAALQLPDAVWVGDIALPRALRQEPADAALIEPNYVRPPDVTPPRPKPASGVVPETIG